MRTIKIKCSPKGDWVFITDWNFAKWTLHKNTNDTWSCKEIPNVEFEGVEKFRHLLYGEAEIGTFTNYFVKIEY